jgi:hypothetical protein
LGDVVLLIVVGLLKATLDGDDPLQARHLELEVCLVRDDHELSEAWSTKKGMVDTRKVDYLKGEWFLMEVVWLTKGDVEPDTPEEYSFLPRHDAIEQHLDGGIGCSEGCPSCRGCRRRVC